MAIIVNFMPKRNTFGNQMLGRIQGFKTFLDMAEKDKIEELAMNNPTYFYDILPYAYVLGVSDIWIKKFESLTLQPPNWYHGTGSFHPHTFMASTMYSASHAMTSAPSQSGGGSSGGGSSGGGSGGGGGGSW
jgi:uncharacterized membrane protein